jgi:hypothetical protein
MQGGQSIHGLKLTSRKSLGPMMYRLLLAGTETVPQRLIDS